MAGPDVRSLASAIEQNRREYEQIVIGAGSSALTFLHAAFHGSESHKFCKQSTLVIGQDDLWARTTPTHPVGQPPSLIATLPNAVPPNMQGPLPPGDGVGPQSFISAGGIVEHNKALKSQIEQERALSKNRLVLRFLSDMVTNVSLEGMWYNVITKKNGNFQARQVIVGSGIGEQKKLAAIKLKVTNEQKLKAPRRDYPEVTDAVTYYNSTPPRGLKVLIYGGSATSSWSAAHATAMGGDYTWICRQGIGQISTEGNPAGRNSPIILEATKRGKILQGEIKSIEIVDPVVADGPRIKVTIESTTETWTRRRFPLMELRETTEIEWTRVASGKWVKAKETPSFQVVPQLRRMQMSKTRNTRTEYYHQLVYAIGSDPTALGGPGQILSQGIKNKLEVVWDKDYRYLQSGKDAVIALCVPDGSLWVVGAAVFGGLGIEKLKNLTTAYAKQGDMLPFAARPPEGIPILTYAINKLTGNLQEGSNINLDKATPTEIYQELVRVFRPDTQKEILEDMTESLLEVRKDTKFGLTNDEVENVFGHYMETYGILPREL